MLVIGGLISKSKHDPSKPNGIPIPMARIFCILFIITLPLRYLSHLNRTKFLTMMYSTAMVSKTRQQQPRTALLPPLAALLTAIYQRLSSTTTMPLRRGLGLLRRKCIATALALQSWATTST